MFYIIGERFRRGKFILSYKNFKFNSDFDAFLKFYVIIYF